MTSILTTEDRHGEESLVKRGSDRGAATSQGLRVVPEAERVKDQTLPGASRGSTVLLTGF